MHVSESVGVMLYGGSVGEGREGKREYRQCVLWLGHEGIGRDESLLLYKGMCSYEWATARERGCEYLPYR